MSRILLAIDGSPYTKRVLAYLGAHEELLGTGHDYTALTVLAPLPTYVGNCIPGPLDDYYHQEAERLMASVRDFARRHHWTLHERYVVGDPGDAIAEQATSGHHDLVVMGTHGHSNLLNVVMGSVATRVLARCKIPVLLIR